MAPGRKESISRATFRERFEVDLEVGRGNDFPRPVLHSAYLGSVQGVGLWKYERAERCSLKKIEAEEHLESRNTCHRGLEIEIFS